MSRPGVGENHTANWRNYAEELEQQLAEAQEQIQVLVMEVKGRNPDGTIIPAKGGRG